MLLVIVLIIVFAFVAVSFSKFATRKSPFLESRPSRVSEFPLVVSCHAFLHRTRLAFSRKCFVVKAGEKASIESCGTGKNPRENGLSRKPRDRDGPPNEGTNREHVQNTQSSSYGNRSKSSLNFRDACWVNLRLEGRSVVVGKRRC